MIYQNNNVRVVSYLARLLSVVMLFSYNAKAASLDHWDTINASHSAFDAVKSNQAQDGESLLLIDSTVFEFNAETDIYSIGRPTAYAVQTLGAEQFSGKSVHISGFAKEETPDFVLLKANFETHLQKENEKLKQSYEGLYDTDFAFLDKHDEYKREHFSNFIRRSHENSDYGIWVLLHMNTGDYQEASIEKHFPTTRGKNNRHQWNRFNLEIDVVEGCRAISIVLWNHGLNIVKYDHLTMVDHGDSVSDNDTVLIVSNDDILFEYFEERPIVINPELMNSSFE